MQNKGRKIDDLSVGREVGWRRWGRGTAPGAGAPPPPGTAGAAGAWWPPAPPPRATAGGVSAYRRLVSKHLN